MRNAAAYANVQAMTLGQERAFEELYLRLARRSAEARAMTDDATWAEVNTLLDRCVSALGYMSGLIDVSKSYETAAAILSLNRFAIGALIRTKSEHDLNQLEGLPALFVSLAEIFTAMDSHPVSSARPISA